MIIESNVALFPKFTLKKTLFKNKRHTLHTVLLILQLKTDAEY